MGLIKLKILATEAAGNISIHLGVRASLGKVEVVHLVKVELIEKMFPIVFVHYNYNIVIGFILGKAGA